MNPVTDNPVIGALMTSWLPNPADQQCAHECLVHALDLLPDACISQTQIISRQFVQPHPAAATRRRRHFKHFMMLPENSRTLGAGTQNYLATSNPDPANPNLPTSFSLVHPPPVMFFALQRNAWMGTGVRFVRSSRTFQSP